MHDYDRSSKWLIQHHGDSILRLGGITDIKSWRPLQAEVVQPRQLPDGLLEVQFLGQERADYFLTEIATYPEERLDEQVLRGSMLVYLARRVMPEVLTLVLRPRGESVGGTAARDSRLGWTQVSLRWRVVELWTIPAEQLLAANDVGLIPWVPLTQIDGPPEAVLRQAREQIDSQAPIEERGNLLAVAQVLTRLRYNELGLLQIFGGSQAMIESPLIQEVLAERMHRAIASVLLRRFGTVPHDVLAQLKLILDDVKLDELTFWAGECPDLDSFRTRLS